MTEVWTQIAAEALDHLVPFGPVILMGLESVRRHMGRNVDRTELVKARSVYALLKTSFERDNGARGPELLDQFVKEPDRYRETFVQLVADRAAASPDDLGRKLVALTNRWREEKRPLP